MTKWTRRLGWPHAALAIALFLIALPLARAAGVTLPTFGDPIAGLTATEMGEFIDGKTEFNEAEEPDEGLGPAFNGASCVECHSRPAIGGDSDITETRFGRYDTVNGKRVFNPLTELGGSLLQKKSISPECAEVLPPERDVTTERKTTPLFGLGLVDAVPDGVLAGIAALQQRITPNLAGRVHRVIDAATGAPRAGRFGWKAQQASLFTFSGDAYLNEMGITTPLFPTDNAPNGNLATLRHCEMLNEPGTADPEDKGDGIVAFFNFMSRLAPPPRGPITSQVQAARSSSPSAAPRATCRRSSRGRTGSGRSRASSSTRTPISCSTTWARSETASSRETRRATRSAPRRSGVCGCARRICTTAARPPSSPRSRSTTGRESSAATSSTGSTPRSRRT